MYASVQICTALNNRAIVGWMPKPDQRFRRQRRDRELAELRLRLLNQLDQRVGREKAVLRRAIAVLEARLRRR